MILKDGHSTQTLLDYRDGKIQKGLGLGIYFDDYFLHKKGQLNFILGHDNVGKSYFVEWYFLALATNHDLTFTLFMDENTPYKVFRDMLAMYYAKPIDQMTDKEIHRGVIKLEHHFKFVDNTKRYTPEELLKVFDETNTDVYLLDPYNALKTSLSYSGNYEVLNEFKMYCKTKNKTIYINAHPSTASGRKQAVYPKGHDWEGHLLPPFKDDIEGGKPFSNKADDFLIVHRLNGHEELKFTTFVDVRKVKDTHTGGQQTQLNNPILFDFNFGHGFKCGGVDCIKRPKDIQVNAFEHKPKEIVKANFTEIGMNNNFDECPF
jgi:archaellum biogenesis ATPase FlaH